MRLQRPLFSTTVDRELPHPVVELWIRAKRRARVEGRLPVGVVDTLDFGRLLVVHTNDVDALAGHTHELSPG